MMEATPEFREWFTAVSGTVAKAMQDALRDCADNPDDTRIGDKLLLFDKDNNMSIGDFEYRHMGEASFMIHKALAAQTSLFNGVVFVGLCDCPTCGGTVLMIGMHGDQTLLAKAQLDKSEAPPVIGVLEYTDPASEPMPTLGAQTIH